MKTISGKLYIMTVFMLASLGICTEADAQQLGVKTNALMWTCMAPNAGLEIVVGERSSIDLSAFCKPCFSRDRGVMLNSRIIGFQPEYRYWFNGRPMTREFIGVSAMLADYDLRHKEYVYDGNAFSLGVVGGYSFIIGSSWRLELCGGFSFLGFLQKRYHMHDSYDDYFVGEPVRANSWGYKLFPARLGVTFTYIIR